MVRSYTNEAKRFAKACRHREPLQNDAPPNKKTRDCT